MELVTAANKILSSGSDASPAVLTNLTTVRQTGGTLYLNYNGRVENLGKWRVEKDGDVFWRNAGNFGVFQNRGDFSKADTPGTVSIQNLSFTNWGRLFIPHGEVYFPGSPQDLGPGALQVGLCGPTLLSDRGRVRFGGGGRLNGPLEIALTNNFVPAPGQTWEVARFGTRVGKFTTLDTPPAPDGYAWNVTYDTTTARLFLAPSGLPAGLVAYYPAEGNAQDGVGIHHGTNQNGAGFSAGKLGQAFALDGTNDVIHLGAWSPGSQWTVAAWVKPSATPAGRHTIVGGVQDCTDWAITMQSGIFGAVIRQPGDCTLTVLSGTNAVPGRWYLLTATSDGATARLYVNGQLTVSTNVEPNYSGTISGTLIGGEICCANGNFPGLVDEVAIFDRAIGLDEITVMYNNGNGGPLLNCITSAAGLAAWLPGEGNALNAAGLPHGVWQGTASYRTGLVGQAFSFDGVDDYLELANSSTVQPASLTVECWFNASNSLAALVSKPLGVGVMDSFVLWLQSGELRASIAGNGSQSPPVSAPFIPVPGVWYHAAFTFDTNSGQQTLYVNGTAIASANANIAIAYDSHPLLIGADLGFGSLNLPLHGQVDEFALYHRALNASEISLIYAAGSSGRCRGGGPAVVAVSPAPYLTNDFNRLQAVFNVVPDPATFSGVDVTLTGPDGAIPQAHITTALATNGNGRTIDILFPMQTTPGAYAVSIGTNIQNAFDAFAASVFNATLTFDKTGPRITNATPAGTITTLPSFFDVFFDTDILIGSFTTTDVALNGSGASPINSVQRLNARKYRIHLATLLPPGTFQLSVGPNITDLAGNAMDQDTDGLRGGIPGDVFNSSLVIEIAELAVGGLQLPASFVVGQPAQVVWAVTNLGTTVREDASPNTFRVAITRSGLLTSNLVVQLSSSSTNDLTVPSGVVILAGQSRANFEVTIHTDGIVDGPESVVLRATATNAASGQAIVHVVDVDIPALTLEFASATMLEGQLASITLHTDTVSTQDVVVYLSSSASSQLLVPDSVILPANSLSVALVAQALDDNFLESDLTPLVREVGVLPARSSLTIPVKFTRLLPRPGDVSSAGRTLQYSSEHRVGTGLRRIRHCLQRARPCHQRKRRLLGWLGDTGEDSFRHKQSAGTDPQFPHPEPQRRQQRGWQRWRSNACGCAPGAAHLQSHQQLCLQRGDLPGEMHQG